MQECYIGVDVAFAKRKRLPIVVSVWEQGRLCPLPLRKAPIAPPRGSGNAAAIRPEIVAEFAEDAAAYLERVCEHFAVRPGRIAIDAPSAPCSDSTRRAAEIAMDRAGISCFATPSTEQWELIRERVAKHLAGGGAESRIPHANQLWMLPGFALFHSLAKLAPCLEVFPQAIARVLGAAQIHKFKEGGVGAQLRAASVYTGWPASPQEEAQLRFAAFAPLHDCLDAYLASWVAALSEADRHPYGAAPHDVIWVPRLAGTG